MHLHAVMHAALITTAATIPVRQPEPDLPSDWRKLGNVGNDIIPSSHTITVVFSLKSQNLDKLRNIALSVSDPSSPKYGQYLSGAEVHSLTASTAEHIRAVEQWLQGEGVPFKTYPGVGIQIDVSRVAAEELLKTAFHRAINDETGQKVVRAGDFWLPAEVHEAVAAVYGMHGLPLPPRVPLAPLSRPDQPANVTPAVLEKTYNVSGVTPKGSTRNRQAVAEFQGQSMAPADLAKFFKEFVTSATADKIYKFVGDNGTSSDEGGIEASLDVDYIMGVAPGVLTEFWYWKGNDFCGDLKNWTSAIISTNNPPLVHSVSYGWQGNMSEIGCSQAHIDDVDTNLVKLASMGITIIVSSGDSGSGYSRDSSVCHGTFLHDAEVEGILKGKPMHASSAEDCCEESSDWDHVVAFSFVPPKEKQGVGTCRIFTKINGTKKSPGVTSGGSAFVVKPKMYPSWPASSPWVTAVGATRFIDQKIGNAEMATDQFGSGGGFSTMFPTFKAQEAAVQQYLKIAKGLPPAGSYPVGGRATPDVSALGEGFQVVANGHIGSVGGTSASAPTFAGFVSLLNEARIDKGMPAMGYLNPFLYQNQDAFRDVTVGTNAIGRGTGPMPFGFPCEPGWDPATGLGTPNFQKLLSKAMGASPNATSIFV